MSEMDAFTMMMVMGGMFMILMFFIVILVSVLFCITCFVSWYRWPKQMLLLTAIIGYIINLFFTYYTIQHPPISWPGVILSSVGFGVFECIFMLWLKKRRKRSQIKYEQV